MGRQIEGTGRIGVFKLFNSREEIEEEIQRVTCAEPISYEITEVGDKLQLKLINIDVFIYLLLATEGYNLCNALSPSKKTNLFS